MSRIGKQPITVPAGVEASFSDGVFSVKGPRGSLQLPVHANVTVTQTENTLHVTVAHPDVKSDRALWGLFQRLVQNMVIGVTNGFERQLEVNGVGFKVAVQGNVLNLALGFSHPVVFDIPAGIEAKLEKNVITISGIDKQLVGETAARIRALKKPEPYKGKGIKYIEEVIRRKATKAAKSGGK